MLSFLTPHWQLNSILELDTSFLRERGLHGLLLDVDCTLKNHYEPAFDFEVVQWIGRLRADGIRLCLVSNGMSARISPLAESLGLAHVAQALKPLPVGCRAALRKIDLAPTQAALMGDQMFTDVLAGRLAGLFTILVHPTTRHEPWITRLKRPLERRLLRRMNDRSSHPEKG